MKRVLLTALFSTSIAYSQTLYPEVVFGGKRIGDMVVYEKDGVYRTDNELTFGQCKSKTLNDFGNISVDMEEGVLYIQPFEKCLEKTEISYLSKQKQKFIDTKSFYLNYTLNADNNSNRTLTLQSGIFAYDTFFYSDFTLNKEKTVRNQTYIQRDYVDSMVRVRLGDAFTRTYMLMPGFQVFGLTVNREPSVNPNERLFRTFDYTVTLTNPSIVEIYSNKTLIDRRELSTGIYSFRDLPVGAINNAVEIKVIDKTTLQERVLSVPFVFSGNLLKKGVWDYSFSAGFRRQDFDTYSGFGYGGYARYGLLDWLTAGFSFTGRKQAVHIDSALFVGVLTAGIDSERKYLVNYSYSSRDYFFGISKTDTDTRLSVSKWFDNIGRITLSYHRNSRDFISLQYNTNIWKGVLDITLTKTERDNQIRIGYIKTFGSRPNIVAFNANASKEQKQYSARYTYAFREYDEKSFGLDASLTKTDIQNQYTIGLNGKYINLYRLNIFKTGNEKENINLIWSGSIGCVGSICRVGEPVTGAFAVGNHLQANSRKAVGVLNLIPYYYQEIVDDKDDITQSRIDVMPKPGQGITIADKKIYKAVVYYQGKPLILTDLKLNGEDTFTGKNGEVIFESNSDTVEIEVFGKNYIRKIEDGKIFLEEDRR